MSALLSNPHPRHHDYGRDQILLRAHRARQDQDARQTPSTRVSLDDGLARTDDE